MRGGDATWRASKVRSSSSDRSRWCSTTSPTSATNRHTTHECCAREAHRRPGGRRHPLPRRSEVRSTADRHAHRGDGAQAAHEVRLEDHHVVRRHRGGLTFVPVAGGTWMTWSWEISPKGPLRLLTPG